MKPLRFALLLSLPLALLACSPPSALAQSAGQKHFHQIESMAAASYPGCAGRSETTVAA